MSTKRSVELAIGLLSCLAVGVILLADDDAHVPDATRVLDGQLITLQSAGQDRPVLALQADGPGEAAGSLYVVLSDDAVFDRLNGSVGRQVRVHGQVSQLRNVCVVQVDRLEDK